jgi:hypothetical protein
MNDAGRISRLLYTARREDDWRRADEWRRLHSRPDALPLPAVDKVPRRPLAAIRRLILRRAQASARSRPA